MGNLKLVYLETVLYCDASQESSYGMKLLLEQCPASLFSSQPKTKIKKKWVYIVEKCFC